MKKKLTTVLLASATLVFALLTGTALHAFVVSEDIVCIIGSFMLFVFSTLLTAFCGAEWHKHISNDDEDC